MASNFDDDLHQGSSIDAALNAFREGCNKGPDRLFVTESWVEPRFSKLRHLLSEPITTEEARVLREAVLKRYRLDDVIEWLEHNPLTWEEYELLRDRRGTRRWRALRERGYFPWKDVRACQKDPDSAAEGMAMAPAVITRHGMVIATNVDEAKRGIRTPSRPLLDLRHATGKADMDPFR